MKETLVEQRVRVGLHCIVGGLMYLLCCIIDVPKLHSHVETVSNDIHGYKTIVKDLLITIRSYLLDWRKHFHIGQANYVA